MVSAILVSALEWFTGFLLEKLFHHKWWDYSRMPLNLNGYICLPFSVLWGAVCALIVRFVHPLIRRLYGFLQSGLGLPFWLCFAVFWQQISVLRCPAF